MKELRKIRKKVYFDGIKTYVVESHNKNGISHVKFYDYEHDKPFKNEKLIRIYPEKVAKLLSKKEVKK